MTKKINFFIFLKKISIIWIIIPIYKIQILK
jgi:hypothetical protein